MKTVDGQLSVGSNPTTSANSQDAIHKVEGQWLKCLCLGVRGRVHRLRGLRDKPSQEIAQAHLI